MPKSKKPRKKHKPMQPKVVKIGDATKEQQIQHLWGNKVPYCKVCDTSCRISTDEEVAGYRMHVDPNYNLKFIWVPECECWENEPEWMADEPR